MSMQVMRNRLGDTYDKWKLRYQKLLESYLHFFVKRKNRISGENRLNYSITAANEWKQRFLGITSEGIPVWMKKNLGYKSCLYETFCQIIDKEELYCYDKECKTEEVVSYAKWKRRKDKLAFIYLGVFWTFEEEENLNDAARRFIITHPEVKTLFEKNREEGNYNWIKEDRIYIYELFKDGALIFKDNRAIISYEAFTLGDISGLWAMMAAEGFFSKEKVENVLVTNNFSYWYNYVL